MTSFDADPGLIAGRYRLRCGTARGAAAEQGLAATDEWTGDAVTLVRLAQGPGRHDVDGLLGLGTRAHGIWPEVRCVTREQDTWWRVEQGRTGLPVSRLEVALPTAVAIRVVRSLAEGLAELHAQGIAHGGVSPEHVWLEAPTAVLSGPGSAGTRLVPGQAAPERFRGAASSARTDLYGLGLVLHHLLTGREAFPGGDWATVGRQERGCGALELPAGVARLLEALLHPDPAHRPPSARAVARALRQLQRAPGVPARVQGPTLAPLRPRANHALLVRAVDLPETRCAGRELSKTRANELAAELRRSGLQVEVVRVALGGRDLLMALGCGLLGHLVVPMLGGLLGTTAGLVWRSRQTRPECADGLPALEIELPSGGEATDSRGLGALGVSLLVAAALMAWSGSAGVLGLVVVAAAVWRASRLQSATAADPGTIRVELLLDELRARGLERVDPRDPTDRGLAWLGAVEALRRDWQEGRCSGAEVRERAGGLSRVAQRATDGGPAGEAPAGSALLPLLRGLRPPPPVEG